MGTGIIQSGGGRAAELDRIEPDLADGRALEVAHGERAAPLGAAALSVLVPQLHEVRRRCVRPQAVALRTRLALGLPLGAPLSESPRAAPGRLEDAAQEDAVPLGVGEQAVDALGREPGVGRHGAEKEARCGHGTSVSMRRGRPDR